MRRRRLKLDGETVADLDLDRDGDEIRGGILSQRMADTEGCPASGTAASVARLNAHGVARFGRIDEPLLTSLDRATDRVIDRVQSTAPTAEEPGTMVLRDGVHYAIGEDGRGDPRLVSRLWRFAAPFRRLLKDSSMLASAAAIFGEPVVPIQQQLMWRRAGAAEMGWHWEGAPPEEVGHIRGLMGVYLDDSTVDNGCLRVVPGSHRWPRAECEALLQASRLDEQSTMVPARRGDVIVHLLATVHGSTANRTTSIRRSIYLDYMPLVALREEFEEAEIARRARLFYAGLPASTIEGLRDGGAEFFADWLVRMGVAPGAA